MCHCLPLLELTLHALRNEPNVVAVMVPVNAQFYRNNPLLSSLGYCTSDARFLPVSRNGARELDNEDTEDGELAHEEPVQTRPDIPSVSFDVDIVCHGGARWIKVKGTSQRICMPKSRRRNRWRSTSFLDVINNFRLGAWWPSCPMVNGRNPSFTFTSHRNQKPLRCYMHISKSYNNNKVAVRRIILILIKYFSFEAMVRFGLQNNFANRHQAVRTHNEHQRRRWDTLSWEDAGTV